MNEAIDLYLPVKTSFKSTDCDDEASGLAAISEPGDNSLIFSESDEISDVDGDAWILICKGLK